MTTESISRNLASRHTYFLCQDSRRPLPAKSSCYSWHWILETVFRVREGFRRNLARANLVDSSWPWWKSAKGQCRRSNLEHTGKLTIVREGTGWKEVPIWLMAEDGRWRLPWAKRDSPNQEVRFICRSHETRAAKAHSTQYTRQCRQRKKKNRQGAGCWLRDLISQVLSSQSDDFGHDVTLRLSWSRSEL